MKPFRLFLRALLCHEAFFANDRSKKSRIKPLRHVGPLRFVLLGSLFVLSMPGVLAQSLTIQVVVPSYDYPPAGQATTGTGIANDGKVVGQYVLHSQQASFLRTRKGNFSSPIAVQRALYTNANGVNSDGVVCGTFYDRRTANERGFFFDGSIYTFYDVPGAVHTDLTGVNDAGDFVGYYEEGSSTKGFVNIGGVLTTFSVLGSNSTVPQAINNLGQVVGYYSDHYGFFRDTDGTLIAPISYPGAMSTICYGLNDQGLIAGAWEDLSFKTHGFVRTADNQFSSWDYPDDRYPVTFFKGINNSGYISGTIWNAAISGDLHAFIARVSSR